MKKTLALFLVVSLLVIIAIVTSLRGDNAEIAAFDAEATLEPDESVAIIYADTLADEATITDTDTPTFDDDFWAQARVQRVETEFGTDLENEIRAQVIPLLLEDFDILYYELRSNIVALANTVYRRMDFDLWERMQEMREEIEVGGYYMGGTFIPSFGGGITDFDEMLADGANMMVRRLETIDILMAGSLHMHLRFLADDEAIFDFQDYPFGLRYLPHPDFDKFIKAELTVANSRNVTTRVIEPGKIAYMSIANASNSIDADRQQLLSFYEEIQNYEHLVIDIRRHWGGYSDHFPETVIRLLIDEPVYATYYIFFAAGTYANWRLDDVPFSHPIETMCQTGYFSVYHAREFVEKRGMTEFNQDDLEHLSYAVEFIYRIEPIEWGFPFNGKIWLLTGNRTSSAGERVAIEAMSSGFATLAGERTGGISTGDRMFIHLPNTNIIQPVDVGYVVDSLGRAQTEFGVIPHYLAPPRVNALDMVLAIIAEMDE